MCSKFMCLFLAQNRGSNLAWDTNPPSQKSRVPSCLESGNAPNPRNLPPDTRPSMGQNKFWTNGYGICTQYGAGVWQPHILIFAVGVECGENRGRTGGEPGAPKRTGGEPGAFGKRTGGEPGAFGIHLQRVPGEKRGLLGQEPGENRGEGIFEETRDPTRDLNINEQDRP